MTDVHRNGEQEFVCLEAATTEMQLLPAGVSTIIAQEISIINVVMCVDKKIYSSTKIINSTFVMRHTEMIFGRVWTM